jgi:hypothetical protein
MTLPQWRLPGASVAVRGVRGKLRAPGLNGGGSACTSRQSINARHGIGRSQSAELGPNLGPTAAIGITERLLAIGRLLHPRSLETHRPIPPIWGSRGREFKCRQPYQTLNGSPQGALSGDGEGVVRP